MCFIYWIKISDQESVVHSQHSEKMNFLLEKGIRIMLSDVYTINHFDMSENNYIRGPFTDTD